MTDPILTDAERILQFFADKHQVLSSGENDGGIAESWVLANDERLSAVFETVQGVNHLTTLERLRNMRTGKLLPIFNTGSLNPICLEFYYRSGRLISAHIPGGKYQNFPADYDTRALLDTWLAP